MSSKIFISTPISGFDNRDEYKEFRNYILQLIRLLKVEGFQICSELERVFIVGDYDTPSKSVEDDFNNIISSNIFILIHPKKMQSSSLIELGFACAHNKRIIIIGDYDNLPYLAKGLQTSCIDTTMLKFEDSPLQMSNALKDYLL